MCCLLLKEPWNCLCGLLFIWLGQFWGGHHITLYSSSGEVEVITGSGDALRLCFQVMGRTRCRGEPTQQSESISADWCLSCGAAHVWKWREAAVATCHHLHPCLTKGHQPLVIVNCVLKHLAPKSRATDRSSAPLPHLSQAQGSTRNGRSLQ